MRILKSLPIILLLLFAELPSASYAAADSSSHLDDFQLDIGVAILGSETLGPSWYVDAVQKNRDVLCGGKENGNDYERGRCDDIMQKAEDVELNRFYLHVLGSVSPATYVAVRNAEQKWVAFRNAEFAAADTYGLGQGGSEIPLFIEEHDNLMTVERVAQLSLFTGRGRRADNFRGVGTPGDSIERTYQVCLSTVAASIGREKCAANMMTDYDNELNQVYQSVLSRADAPTKIALQNAQGEWLDFREAETVATRVFCGKGRGRKIGLALELANIEIVRERIADLMFFTGIEFG